jgi:hypothetical protein
MVFFNKEIRFPKARESKAARLAPLPHLRGRSRQNPESKIRFRILKRKTI